MHYVYIIESISCSGEFYTGMTGNLRARLAKHNEGGSPHTAKSRPWKLISYHAFPHRSTAAAFEKYLKTGSGRAFAKKRFFPAEGASSPST